MSDTLFEAVCNKETLYSAWLRVKEKNTTGGIDFKTVQDYAVLFVFNIWLLHWLWPTETLLIHEKQ